MVIGRPETVTVLFTDLVGSTAWRMRVGDAVADARMAGLERASREVVESAGGSVVKGVGDGVMATFTSAVVAVDVAAALQGVAGRLGVCGSRACLRVGVSTGGMDRGELGTFVFTAGRFDHSHAALGVLIGLNGQRMAEACGTNVDDLGLQRRHRTLRILGKGNKPASSLSCRGLRVRSTSPW